MRLLGEWNGRLYVGVDVLDMHRFRLAVERSGQLLVERVTTESEREAGRHVGLDVATTTALCFNLKEGVVKAIGGLPLGTNLRDIRILLSGLSSATKLVNLRGLLADWAQERRLCILSSSISMTQDIALASVIAYQSAPTIAEAAGRANATRREGDALMDHAGHAAADGQT